MKKLIILAATLVAFGGVAACTPHEEFSSASNGLKVAQGSNGLKVAQGSNGLKSNGL